MVTKLMGNAVNGPRATVEDGQSTMYAVGSAAIASAANSGKKVTVTKGGEITGINANVKITVADGVDGVTVNGKRCRPASTPYRRSRSRPTTTTIILLHHYYRYHQGFSQDV